MPQVLFIAAAGAGLYAAYQVARRFSASRSEVAPGVGSQIEPRDLGALKRDPETGEFRPEAVQRD